MHYTCIHTHMPRKQETDRDVEKKLLMKIISFFVSEIQEKKKTNKKKVVI